MKSNSRCQQVHTQQQGEVRQGSLLGLKDAPDLQNSYFQREQQLQQHLKQQNQIQILESYLISLCSKLTLSVIATLLLSYTFAWIMFIEVFCFLSVVKITRTGLKKTKLITWGTYHFQKSQHQQTREGRRSCRCKWCNHTRLSEILAYSNTLEGR